MVQEMHQLGFFFSENPFVLYPLSFIVGIIVGSFLNVCIYRLPDEEKSIVMPGSYCPSCKQSIVWYDNIPLLSYVLLHGRCRFCGSAISIRYWWVELVTGIIFTVCVWQLGLSAETLVLLYLICSLLVASVVDFQFKIIPDEITLYGMLFGLVLSYVFPEIQGEMDRRLGIANSILGLLIGGGIVYGVAVVGDYIFKKESMGGGDIKLLAMIGAFVGPKLVILSFFLSPYFAIFFALYYKFFKKEDTIPYGPFLSMGAIATVFFGERILNGIGVF